ncbi:hypothetical protein ABH917_001921 [Thermobifida halotolerans]|uniref:hypothetical protein n=1 Tax=Thermobifida halotolerans TaxID=483545 RepID=UPI0035195771
MNSPTSMRRMRVCSGGSMRMNGRSSAATACSPSPSAGNAGWRASELAAGCASAARTSACLVTSHAFFAPGMSALVSGCCSRMSA